MKKITLILLITFITTSCSDFEELNINPNEPSMVDAGVLFTSGIRESIKTTSLEAFLISNNISQITAKTLRSEVDSYNWNAFPTIWEGLYKSLTDIEKTISICKSNNNLKCIGAAEVFKVWVYSQLTNSYGDIPYSEAIKGDEKNITPKYDKQEDIYIDMLEILSKSISKLNSNGEIPGDILYNGNHNLWIKFSNSLKFRLLIYASKKLDVKAEITDLYNEMNFINSNSENATLDFLKSYPNQFPTIPLKQGDFDAVGASSSALEVLKKYNDPRLSRYYRPDNMDFQSPNFSSAENGVGGQTASRLGLSFYDYPGHTTASEKSLSYAKGIIMTSSEMNFLICEAITRGLIDGNAELYFKEGIKLSHEYYEVNYLNFGYKDFNDFYEKSGINFDNIFDLWEQKWLSMYFTALDPYFDVRRMYVGYDVFNGFNNLNFLNIPVGKNYNNYNLPLRFLYPGQEQSLNSSNYNDANSRYNTDKLINGKMWIVSD